MLSAPSFLEVTNIFSGCVYKSSTIEGHGVVPALRASSQCQRRSFDFCIELESFYIQNVCSKCLCVSGVGVGYEQKVLTEEKLSSSVRDVKSDVFNAEPNIRDILGKKWLALAIRHLLAPP